MMPYKYQDLILSEQSVIKVAYACIMILPFTKLYEYESNSFSTVWCIEPRIQPVLVQIVRKMLDCLLGETG